jgi:hypothetical protein
METNTPVTPSSPEGNPIWDNHIQDSPTNNDPTKNPTENKVSPPARPKGPNVSAIVVGLVAMVLAGLIIASETAGLRVDWSRLGPGGIVGIGVLLVVLGAIGLVRRHDDS